MGWGQTKSAAQSDPACFENLSFSGLAEFELRPNLRLFLHLKH